MQIESYGSAGPLSAHACKWNGAGRTRRVLSGDAARGHGWIYTRTVGSGKGWMRITSRETGMSWGIGRCGSGLGWKANWGNEKWKGNEWVSMWVGEELGWDECWVRMNKCPSYSKASHSIDQMICKTEGRVRVRKGCSYMYWWLHAQVKNWSEFWSC